MAIDKNKEYHIALGKGEIARYVLLPGDPGRVDQIAKYFDSARQVAHNREYNTYTGHLTGFDGAQVPISATSTGIGCPSTAICVEELIKCGADTFIRVGTAGGLQPGIEVGDVTISTATVREEGTTRQYIPLEYPAVANLDVTLALREAAQQLKFRYHVGISHTKDAFYTEGVADLPSLEHCKLQWKAWERGNVLSTSMEAAALFVIASIKKVRAGEVLAIIGLTYKDEPIVAKIGIDEAIKIAIEAVRILDRLDRAAAGARKGKKK